jgi:ubiquinone/menaquinone biosynthesis C-methylase UbiE
MFVQAEGPPAAGARAPRFMEPGAHTAYGGTVPYRLGKLARRGVIKGDWLDCGCAEGYFADALVEHGADSVVGVEAIEGLVLKAAEREHPPSVRFIWARAEALPLPDANFDGVLLNEVLEHVANEEATLSEVLRVLRPGGHLALFSPNRGFPIEGHGLRLNDRRSFGHPVPLMPWLPGRLTERVATARNYWPRELRELVTQTGFEVVEQGWAMPQFELYRWLPEPAIRRFRAAIPRLERSPAAPLLAVSTYILARKAEQV